MDFINFINVPLTPKESNFIGQIGADLLIRTGEVPSNTRILREIIKRAMMVKGTDVPTVESNPVEWIPCSERLPETEGEYLTCDKKGNIHTMYHFQSNKHPFAIGDNHPRYYPVIAWMPLPDPYNADMRKKVE